MTIPILLAFIAGTAPDTLSTARGPIVVQPISHASFVLLYRDFAVYVDPVGQLDAYAGLPAAGLILITHDHGDHLSPDLVGRLRTADTVVVVPASCAEALKGKGTVTLANGEKHMARDVTIEAVAMYNTTKERADFHPRGKGNGYVLELGGARIYIAGDSEDTPEMRHLKDIDAAFLPMNLPYTMTVDQAAAAVRAMRPRVVYPYHYRGAGAVMSDLDRFTKLVGDASQVRRLDWYP